MYEMISLGNFENGCSLSGTPEEQVGFSLQRFLTLLPLLRHLVQLSARLQLQLFEVLVLLSVEHSAASISRRFSKNYDALSVLHNHNLRFAPDPDREL